MGCNMEATRGTNEPVSGELVSVAHALSLPAESYGNDPDIEMAWAMRAMQHAEVYYKLISSVDPQFLKLTKVDDQIYSEFRENFERLRVDVLDPEELKSEAAKEEPRGNFTNFLLLLFLSSRNPRSLALALCSGSELLNILAPTDH
ncbi:protein PBDC1-like isoform X4 [Manis pentadactyla]|uniref:protein PBDC1-like isoform X4 n=1 Tax=Manis pentadactyla TaxID=143292 RepID=UPI00255C693E|nr:protein PBDC1-like isoform X4 [Manis pentadactyla]